MSENILKNNRIIRLVAVIAALAIFIGFVVFMYTQFRMQKQKLNEIMEENARLTQRLDELMRENERIEGNLEYVKSLEGLLRYARDNFGYIGKDEIRVDAND